MDDWSLPSPRIAELIRHGCELLLAAPAETFDAVNGATLEFADPAILADPALVEAIERSNRVSLEIWCEANVLDPGARVTAVTQAESLEIAEDLVRRGLDWLALDQYRTAQNTAWRACMALAISLTDDRDELGELLDVLSRSVFTYVNDLVVALTTHMTIERDRLRLSSHADRLAIVTRLIEGGSKMSDARASQRLGYALARPHTAAVVFSHAHEPRSGALERVAAALARSASASAKRAFVVEASAGALWTWVPGAAGPDLAAFGAELTEHEGVRVAIGPTLDGVAGFRMSHLDALATARLMHRAPLGTQLAAYDDVQVAALATQDEERARAFVHRTLGDLAQAPAEVRETLRVYLGAGHNASATAKTLYTHRNTVVNRLGRAQELLPAPLEGRALQVATALEIEHWLGGGTAKPSAMPPSPAPPL